ncbi:hypothetical protein B0T21DRAFT_59794 [Apiosordaria backusii]|uniref:Secreted protein n=1 Tax=Apiosordaria backusii TaxID=314023 RepID=A0AA40ANB6_9PEZI|nr:hypothetical protein B0T21DRAFT_59794 [Apiosordaria backusii]
MPSPCHLGVACFQHLALAYTLFVSYSARHWCGSKYRGEGGHVGRSMQVMQCHLAIQSSPDTEQTRWTTPKLPPTPTDTYFYLAISSYQLSNTR